MLGDLAVVVGTTAIIQARMGSTRLPGKVMKPLAGHPMLWHVVQRVRAAPGLGQVVVATTDSSKDDEIRAFCDSENISLFSGSQEDVLDRFYQAARSFGADPIVRVTADCPLVDPAIIGQLLLLFAEGGHDYACTAIGGLAVALGANGYPDGLDAECFSFAALERAWREAIDQPDREHVTPYLLRRRDLFDCAMLVPDEDWSGMRLTVDEPEDFALVERVFEMLFRDGGAPFSLEETVRVLAESPDLEEPNRRFVGQEKYRDLWAPIVEAYDQAKEKP